MTLQNEPPNLFYRGSSMKGTFKPGDRLSIEKISFNQIRKGDLIIFQKTIEKNTEFVVHRVKRITPNGLIMRGDNSRNNDLGVVAKDDIIGRVTRYDRGGKIFPAHSGLRGQTHAFYFHTRLRLFIILKQFLRPLYRCLKKSNIVASIWHPKWRLARFQTPQGPLIKFIHKNRTKAVYWTEQNKWICHYPYDLIVTSPRQR